jgi:hypothetical protein
MSHAKQFPVVKNLMLQRKPYNFNVEQIVVSINVPFYNSGLIIKNSFEAPHDFHVL